MNRTLACGLALLLVCGLAEAGTFTIHNTGEGDEEDLDSYWTLVDAPAAFKSGKTFPYTPYISWANDAWESNNSTSKWIGPTESGNDYLPVGTYVYETTFDLKGFDASTASLSFCVLSDNDLLSVHLNGVSADISILEEFAYEDWSNEFEIDSGFVSGKNELRFSVLNRYEMDNPTGLRVKFSDATATVVPLPSAAWLGFGLLGVLGLCRRLLRSQVTFGCRSKLQ